MLKVLSESGRTILREGMSTAQAASVEVDMMLFNQFGDHLAETVARSAKLWNADLVVVGTHGRRGIRRVLMGSGAEQTLRMAPVPVLAIRSQESAEPAK